MTRSEPSTSTPTSSPGHRKRCSPSPATSPASSPKTTASASDRWPCAGIDLTTGRVDVVPVPCGSRREDLCPPVRRQATAAADDPMPRGLAPRPGAHARAARRRPRRRRSCWPPGPSCTPPTCPPATTTTKTSAMPSASAWPWSMTSFGGLGVTGRLAPLDDQRPARKRSTRRRQDAPNLPRRPVEHRTLGRHVRGPLPALDVPHAHPRQLRAGRCRRGRGRSGQLRLSPRGSGRDPLPQARGSVLAEHPPLCGLGGAVLRDGRTATPRRTPLPRRRAGHDPARRAARHRRRHLPPGVVARPRRDPVYGGDRLPRWDDTHEGLRRPRHPRTAAHLGGGHRPGQPDPTRRTRSGSGRRCTSRACSAAPRKPGATSAT